jgi:hypothetical protein
VTTMGNAGAPIHILAADTRDVLPVMKIRNRLFFLQDVQPRVMAACRRARIRVGLLAVRLQTPRYALVLILRGVDPVPPALHRLLDDFVARAEALPPEPPLAGARRHHAFVSS